MEWSGVPLARSTPSACCAAASSMTCWKTKVPTHNLGVLSHYDHYRATVAGPLLCVRLSVPRLCHNSSATEHAGGDKDEKWHKAHAQSSSLHLLGAAMHSRSVTLYTSVGCMHGPYVALDLSCRGAP